MEDNIRSIIKEEINLFKENEKKMKDEEEYLSNEKELNSIGTIIFICPIFISFLISLFTVSILPFFYSILPVCLIFLFVRFLLKSKKNQKIKNILIQPLVLFSVLTCVFQIIYFFS